jgi:hypothetical protein
MIVNSSFNIIMIFIKLLSRKEAKFLQIIHTHSKTQKEKTFLLYLYNFFYSSNINYINMANIIIIIIIMILMLFLLLFNM